MKDISECTTKLKHRVFLKQILKCGLKLTEMDLSSPMTSLAAIIRLIWSWRNL